MDKGVVYLVGTGPGDPGLVTVKGLECIRRAEVIIYDRLVNERLLFYARSDAQLIYVGKSPGKHTLRQEEINNLLLEKAREGKTTVRLKGGDPFVFGRGGEEAEFLADNCIPFEIVPGVTSAIAVPAYAGIPVTHRNYSSSFTVITGHEDPAKGKLSIPWDSIATGADTLILLMGMDNLREIVNQLIAKGRAEDSPVALVKWGTRAKQETLVGTLGTIVEKVKERDFGSPAIAIIGKVVSLRKKLNWFESKPLFGKRILITRERSQGRVLASFLEKLGAEIIDFPTIKIVPAENFSELDRAIENLKNYNWIFFTSINGVRYFLNRLRIRSRDIRELREIRIGAIGPRTAGELKRFGIIADYVPREYSTEGLIAGLKAGELKGKRVLLPRSDKASRILPQRLKEMGALPYEVTVYRTIIPPLQIAEVRGKLANREIDLITFTSPSTVKNFAELLNDAHLGTLLKDVRIAGIGPATADALKKLGFSVDIIPKEYTQEGLVQVIVQERWER